MKSYNKRSIVAIITLATGFVGVFGVFDENDTIPFMIVAPCIFISMLGIFWILKHNPGLEQMSAELSLELDKDENVNKEEKEKLK
jgi:hypothetical protein